MFHRRAPVLLPPTALRRGLPPLRRLVSTDQPDPQLNRSQTPSQPIPSPSLSDRIPDEYRKRLDDWKTTLDRKGRDLAVNAGKNLAIVGLKVNEATGYREVERLKQAVKDREQELTSRRIEVKAAKLAYEEAVSTRTSSQQNVNSLLERKHSWTDSDVANFTTLVRSDHASRHAVTTTSEELKHAELAVDKSFTSLMQAILERYHEEQVWSDKIRSVSTWASIVALAANLIVFVGAIAFVEPWKRRRLVQGLEERMSGMMTRVEAELQTLSSSVGDLEGRMAPVASVIAATPETHMGDLEQAPATAPHSPWIASPSPIEQLSAQAPPSSSLSKVLTWATTQLAHVSPPSAERDLVAASMVGAVGGAVTIGLVGVVFRSLGR